MYQLICFLHQSSFPFFKNNFKFLKFFNLTIRYEIPIKFRNIFILILSVLIAGWALYDLTISVADSIVFIALFILFVLNLFREKPDEVPENTHKDESLTKVSLLILLSLILLKYLSLSLNRQRV